MKISINTLYLKLTGIVLLIEIAIALFLKEGFIRFTVGDFLASILVYTLLRSFLKIKHIYIAIIALVISFSIEFLQMFNFLDYLGVRGNSIIAILLGSHFSIEDLIAYALGVITIFIIDLKYMTHEDH
ncbi:DUF2809 domain-containing protein [Olleya sp. YS]|uniref:ribosomal maturation YjgA family protein n=1 Tax=Olleya sp. YS TaxID=3028318 RepID=UPI002434534A|nr:DUF2809 domain-containing protein [Olleya sp. YS]WGD35157.1 DUF2809 domain-containing protein [Olleya sp. YS]